MAIEATESLGALSLGRPRMRGEAALVRRAQQGSLDAFEELFRLHWKQAHRAAYLIVRDSQAAEDIAQEAFLAATRSLDRFDSRRPFGPWLHRIAVNRAIDWSRANRLRPTRDDPAAEAAPEHAPEVSSDLLASLGELTIDHRVVVVLRHLLGYSPGEIAAILDLPRGTVNSRLRRALDQLRPLIEGDGGCA